MKTYTLEEIRNYILSQNSLGDVLYFLNEENIEKSNKKWLVLFHPESDCVFIDNLDNKELNLDYLDELDRFKNKNDAIKYAKDYSQETGYTFNEYI